MQESSLKHIKNIFFDLDHTLWDFETNSALTFQKIFADHDVDVEFENFIEVYKPLNFRYWKLYREEKVTKPELRYRRLKETFDALHKAVSDELINALSVDYIENLPKFNHLIQGTLDILDHLKGNYQLHIITNGFEEVQTRKMESTKILHYFDQVITSESVGVKKPNPLVFEHALRVSNANAHESIMIGDSLEADIQGALNVGMHAMLCDFAHEQNGALKDYLLVHKLSQIKQYL